MKYAVASGVFDPHRRTLSFEGNERELEPRVSDVLLHLIQRPGEVVAREEMLAAIWKTQHISDDVLTRCVNIIRRAFDDDPKSPQVIETVMKRGYRMIAPVRRLDDPVAERFWVLGPRYDTGPLRSSLKGSIVDAANQLTQIEPAITSMHSNHHHTSVREQEMGWRRGLLSVRLRQHGPNLLVEADIWTLHHFLLIVGPMVGYLAGSRAFSGGENGGLVFAMGLIGGLAGLAIGYALDRRASRSLRDRLTIEWYIVRDAFQAAGFELVTGNVKLFEAQPARPQSRG